MKLRIVLSLLFSVLALGSIFSQQLNVFPGLVFKGDPYIISMAQTADGSYLIASRTDHINGLASSNLAKIDASGNLITSFSKVIVDDHILTIAPLANGKILVGGMFKHINGVATSLARLNSDGSIDNSFPKFSSSTGSSFQIQADGKIILSSGGALIRINPDGSADNSFTTFHGPLGYTTSVIFDDSQNIFVADSHSLFKLDKNGNPLSGFPIAVNPGGYFFTLRKYSDKLLIAGDFTTIAGVSRNKVAFINGDGTIASLTWPDAPYIDDMVIAPNGNILVKDLNAVSAYTSGLIKIGDIAYGSTDRLFIDNAGRLLISGNHWMRSIDGPHPYLMRLASNYTVDNTFLCNATYTGGVKAITSQPDGKILVGGDYTFAGINASPNKLTRIKLNGEIDNSFSPDLGASNFVNALDVQPDGKILVCTEKLIRLNKSGSLDNTFFVDQSHVLSKVKFENNSIYLSGDFNAIGGFLSSGIVKLKMNGTADDSFKSALPVNSFVSSFAFQSDKKIIVTGGFTINGERFVTMRLNADGTIDDSFAKGKCNSNGIWGVAVDSADQIYISGSFYQFNGTSNSRFLRLKPNGDIDNLYNATIPFEVNSTVYGLELLSDNEVVVGARTYFSNPALMVKDEAGNTADKEFAHLGDLSSISASYFDGATLYLGGRIVSQDSAVSGISYINIYPVGGNLSNLQASRNGPSKAHLTWTNNFAKASLLIIERSFTNDQNFAPIDSIPASAIAYDDSFITDSTSYYYRIKAINTSSSTGYSSEVSIGPATPQSITFYPITTKIVTDEPFSLSAQASSELPINFTTASDKISIEGNQVTILGAGRVSITASQPGEGEFDAAFPVEHSFCINPAKPTIAIENLGWLPTTLTSSAEAGNQWFMNETAIEGATNKTYDATLSGTYSLQVAADDCLSVFAENVNLVITGDIKIAGNNIEVFPNPVADWLTIFAEGERELKATILKPDGIEMDSMRSQGEDLKINVSGYSQELYIIKVVTQNSVAVKKFMKK